jgi:hydroxyacyl-ACP dehydratase HTD2-like protein with hotdog domain
LLLIEKKKRQQANKCAKTAVAPPPKEIKKVQLPSHFQFFNNSSTTDEKDQACEVWKQGVIQPFKSYQKFMQTNKKMANKKEIKTIEEGKQLVYPESKSADHANLASSLSQVNQ